MDHIKKILQLQNKYIALRHGESKANAAEIIISNLQDASNEAYTLNENGEKQVEISVKDAQQKNLLGNSVMIFSSPFSRCRRTAEIAKEILGTKDSIIIDDRLRERWFGNLDRTVVGNYNMIWGMDSQAKSSGNNEEEIESVVDRTTSLIDDLEKKYSDKTFLLVSHGDVLQILETCFRGIPPFQHRSIKALERAEVRELIK